MLYDYKKLTIDGSKPGLWTATFTMITINFASASSAGHLFVVLNRRTPRVAQLHRLPTDTKV